MVHGRSAALRCLFEDALLAASMLTLFLEMWLAVFLLFWIEFLHLSQSLAVVLVGPERSGLRIDNLSLKRRSLFAVVPGD